MGDLLKNVAPWKLKLLQTGVVGLLIVIAGFILFVLDFSIFGRLLIYIGFIIGFLGIGLSFYALIFKPDDRLR
jgi:hypothetical protein